MSKKVSQPLLFWLSVFAVMAVIFGFWQIWYHIRSPFQRTGPTGQISEQDVIGAYKNLDTDKDGLSDYDEINKYGTSAFLPDSDGDGFSDKEEIDAGSNPLNPKSTPTSKALAEKGKTPTLEQEVKPKVIKGKSNISAQEIRDLLVKEGGLSRDLVNGLSDEDLIKLYNETKKQTGIDLQKLSQKTVKTGNLTETEKMIKQMDPKVLRQMLIAEGADKTMLDKIDDQSLKELFLQTISQGK